MKMHTLLATLALLSAFTFGALATAQAQELDKDTRKTWKKKQRKMETEEFYRIMTEYQKMKRSDNAMERQVKSMSREVTDLNQRIAELEEELRKAKAKNGDTADSTARNTSTTSENGIPAGEDYDQGVVFRVQIGAFTNRDLTKYTNHPRFRAETDADGTKKYTIANFRDYWEADLFKKYLREMGVEDAWIVSYRDGQRTDIANVLGQEEIDAIKKEKEKNTGNTKPETSGGGGGDW